MAALMTTAKNFFIVSTLPFELMLLSVLERLMGEPPVFQSRPPFDSRIESCVSISLWLYLKPHASPCGLPGTHVLSYLRISPLDERDDVPGGSAGGLPGILPGGEGPETV